MARKPVGKAAVEGFMEELGRRFRGAGRIYIAGGAEMVFLGFRSETEAIDYSADIHDEYGDLTAAVRAVMAHLDVSTEPAGPSDFIPLPAGWQDRSRFIARHGRLDFFLLDPVSVALSKIERGSSRDVADVQSLLQAGLVDLAALQSAFEEVVPRLERESLRVDEQDFRRKFESFVGMSERG